MSGSLRQDLDAFADGAEMSMDLRRYICRLKFIPIVERTIEAPHALVNLKVGKKSVSPPYISLATRLSLLDTEFKEDAEMGALVAAYSQVRDIKTMASLLHLEMHPDLQHILGHDCNKSLQVLSQIVYRCDLVSRFASQRQARRAHDKAMAVEGKAAAKVLARLRGPRQRFDSANTMLQHLVLDHLRIVGEVGAFANTCVGVVVVVVVVVGVVCFTLLFNCCFDCDFTWLVCLLVCQVHSLPSP